MPNTFDHGYALLIGVGNHAIEPRLSLPTTVSDVEALRRTLTAPDQSGYPDNKEHVHVLTNDKANNSNIRADLAWLANKVKADKDATAIVYFSGHGFVAPDNAYYLVTQDATPGIVPDTGFKATAFSSLLRDIEAARVVIVMDCCYAQGMAEAKDADLLDEETAKGLEGSESALKSIFDVLGRGQGRAVFLSSQGNEKSYLMGDKSLSVFTYHFIEALQGAGHGAGDTVVTLASLMKYVGKAVPETTQKLYNASQHPFYKFETSDFPVALIRGGKGLPSGGWEAVQGEARDYLSKLARTVINTNYSATVTGGGAIAQGPGSVAVGQGGVMVGGNNTGNVNTGTQVYGDNVRGDKVLGDKIGRQINTRGGSYTGGNVNTRGDFVGRDKIINNYGQSSSADADANLTEEARKLAGMLNDHFDNEELREVAFQLNVDWDNLRGETKQAKAHELVKFCDRRGRTRELKSIVRLARPNLRGQLS